MKAEFTPVEVRRHPGAAAGQGRQKMCRTQHVLPSRGLGRSSTTQLRVRFHKRVRVRLVRLAIASPADRNCVARARRDGIGLRRNGSRGFVPRLPIRLILPALDRVFLAECTLTLVVVREVIPTEWGLTGLLVRETVMTLCVLFA